MNAFTPIRAVAEAAWTDDPRAAAILATFADSPPELAPIDPLDRWTRDDFAFVGERVDALNAIWASHVDAVTPKRGRGEANWDAFDALMAQPTVAEAIEAVAYPPQPAPSDFDLMLADVAGAMQSGAVTLGWRGYAL